MTVRNEKTVQLYAKQYFDLLAMLENLQEFVSTMPAPDENGDIPSVDYGYTGSIGHMWELLRQASDVAYELSDY